jgi:hypothetical protein
MSETGENNGARLANIEIEKAVLGSLINGGVR